MWHTFSAWYTAANSFSSLGQNFRCTISYWPNYGSGATNLPMKDTWTRFTLLVPPFIGASNYMYFVQFQGLGTDAFHKPSGQVDNSVQWMPYQPDYAGLAFVYNSNRMTLCWDIYYQPSNHWYLASTTNLAGTWKSNTVPFFITNTIGSVTLTNIGNSTFYTLKHY